MEAYLGEPLPYPPEVERLRRIELNAIIARHRMVFEAARLAAEAERLNPIKEFLS
jgi:hypothetical protein